MGDLQVHQSESIPAVMKRGSCLIYTGRTVHGAGHNQTKAPRVALNVAYNSACLKQEENQYAAALLVAPAYGTCPTRHRPSRQTRAGAHAAEAQPGPARPAGRRVASVKSWCPCRCLCLTTWSAAPARGLGSLQVRVRPARHRTNPSAWAADLARLWGMHQSRVGCRPCSAMSDWARDKSPQLLDFREACTSRRTYR